MPNISKTSTMTLTSLYLSYYMVLIVLKRSFPFYAEVFSVFIIVLDAFMIKVVGVRKTYSIIGFLFITQLGKKYRALTQAKEHSKIGLMFGQVVRGVLTNYKYKKLLSENMVWPIIDYKISDYEFEHAFIFENNIGFLIENYILLSLGFATVGYFAFPYLVYKVFNRMKIFEKIPYLRT